MPPRPPVDARGLLLVQDVHRRRRLGERVAGALGRDVLRPLGALLGAAQRRSECNVAAAAMVQRLGVACLAGGDGVGQRLAVPLLLRRRRVLEGQRVRREGAVLGLAHGLGHAPRGQTARGRRRRRERGLARGVRLRAVRALLPQRVDRARARRPEVRQLRVDGAALRAELAHGRRPPRLLLVRDIFLNVGVRDGADGAGRSGRCPLRGRRQRLEPLLRLY